MLHNSGHFSSCCLYVSTQFINSFSNASIFSAAKRFGLQMVDKRKNAKKRFMNCLLVAEKIVVFLLNIVKFFMERRKWIFWGVIGRRLGMRMAALSPTVQAALNLPKRFLFKCFLNYEMVIRAFAALFYGKKDEEREGL